MSKYRKQIEEMVWSFSRRDSWSNCKLGWKMNYIDKLKGLSNNWSLSGSLGHDIFEKYGRGEIEVSDMAKEWINRYDDEVYLDFPESMRWKANSEAASWIKKYNKDFEYGDFIGLYDNYKWKVFKFFSEFKGFNSETLEVEMEFEYELPDGNKMKGFIDRVSDGVIVTDYKISKKFTRDKLKEKKRQILLYAPAIKEKYGELPISGYFFFFQTGEHLAVRISQEDVDEALKWMTDGIAEIMGATEFPARIDSMTDKEISKDLMCSALCNFRDICKSRKEHYEK